MAVRIPPPFGGERKGAPATTSGSDSRCAHHVLRMCAHRVVDAARLEREHPWRGGDEGKRGEGGEGGRDDGGRGRETDNLLGPQGCDLVLGCAF